MDLMFSWVFILHILCAMLFLVHFIDINASGLTDRLFLIYMLIFSLILSKYQEARKFFRADGTSLLFSLESQPGRKTYSPPRLGISDHFPNARPLQELVLQKVTIKNTPFVMTLRIQGAAHTYLRH